MMKLGTETASVINNLYSRGVIGEPAPKVGMGVTLLGWTDRYPGTIVSVVELVSKRWSYEIEIRDDDYKVVSGSTMDGSAVYEFSPNPNGSKSVYRKNRGTGFWSLMRKNPDSGKMVMAKSGKGLRIGERDAYYDPSF